MRETICICDKCGHKVNWLYDLPRLIVEGNVINEYPGHTEVCRECAEKLCRAFNEYASNVASFDLSSSYPAAIVENTEVLFDESQKVQYE